MKTTEYTVCHTCQNTGVRHCSHPEECNGIKTYLSELREHHQYFLDCVSDGGDFDTLPHHIFTELCRRHYNVFNLPDGEYVKKV